ncbi:hypothetical protein GCM10023194_52850 [Planotetraspora phitsanulokensis]|uniref:YtxH domain-containing protein n=2 Tax=Planotetraspora phitsanulokensis TaxID=575192 RepID=A0A8J3UCC6_9ACTN|nr:hypothetical protein Pph01_76260 [Planotetraspora phitsanulokensis]
MSLTMKKRRHTEAMAPQAWLGLMKGQARKAGRRVSPMAETARDVAAHRLEDARIWAAPKLDQASHSVEEQLAPMVSAFLAEMSRRVDVPPSRSRRRWPMLALLTGAAIGAIGAIMYRNNAQRWTDTMKDNMREGVSDTTKWSGEQAKETVDKAGRKSDDISGKIS